MTAPARAGGRRWAGLVYLAPSLAILLLIAIIPIGASFVLSFTQYDVLSSPRFIGGDNYARMVGDPMFWTALKNTAIFTLIAVPLQIIIAMALAEALARYSGRKFSQITRSALFVPVVASLILIGTVWQFMLAPNESGFVNSVLSGLGFSTVNFLGQPWVALMSVTAVQVWKHIGYFLVLFYAGVLDIPEEQYEAARLDGASGPKIFRHITMPGLRPITLLCLVLATMWSFQAFDLIYSMTGGGPGNATTTLVMAIYNVGFNNFQMGYASAIAMVLAVIVMILALLQRVAIKER